MRTVKAVALVVLGAVAAFGLGFFAGLRAGDEPSHPNDSAANELGATVEKMARALEHLESRLTTTAPTLAARPGNPGSELGNAQITELLAGITERLDRLSRAQGEGLTPGTPRDRSKEQEESLLSIEDEESQGLQQRHFMSTARDLLERYGVPDRAYYWTGATIRWVYLLNRETPSGPKAIFELIDGYVTAASLERGP